MKLAAAAILLGVATFVRADILEPMEGGRLQLPATIAGDRVLLDTPDGIEAFPRSDFLRIVAEPCPSREWPARKSQAIAQGAAGRLTAALWALDRGLIPQAEEMIRSSREADPHFEPAARLAHVLDRLAAPLPDPDLASLLVHLPRDMATARGPHVLLIHQHPEAEAAERIDVLERVIKAYYLTFAALGFDLPPPSRRLPSAWLATKSAYLAFLNSEGAQTFTNTRGYYHPTRGLMVAYDCRSDPVRAAALGRQEKLSQATDEERNRRIARERIARELARREIDLAVAAHETVHQLVAASRLCPTPGAFPNWLAEGLAMQFEAIEGGRWAGLGRPSALRMADYARIHPPPRLLPILRDEGFGQGYHQDVYARSWALTYYLRTEHPREFVAYLDALRNPHRLVEDSIETRHEPIFLQAIQCPAGKFQSGWHEAMKSPAIPAQVTP